MLKRTIGSIVFFLTMLLFLPAAHAEEIKVNVTATPTELSETGTVAFSFEISNYSDYVISEITITYLGNINAIPLSEPVPPNGSIRDLVLNLSVSESQLGSPIPFTVTCIRNGEPLTQEVSVTINRAADPIISLVREASAEMVRQGETVTLTYTLKNETKFDITGITLIDEQISDTPIVKGQDVLYAGGEFSITRPYIMGTDSVVSAPVVTYTVNGKTKTFSGVEPLTLTMLLIKLDMAITAGMPTVNGVGFTIDVENTGNQEIQNITITDERKNVVNTTPFSLKTGEKATHSFQVVPVMSEPLREVKFTLTGVDPTGAAYTLESAQSYEVYPYVDASQIDVTVAAETVTPWTSETGKLTARVKIVNHSQIKLTNVSVSETNLGVIKSIDLLSTGETQFDYEVTLGSPRNLSFQVKGNDPTGTTRELATCALPVAYGTEETPEATMAPIQTNHNNAFSFLSTTISKILLILGVLMVVSFIVLVALSFLERSRTGGIRFDEEYGDDDDELNDFFHDDDQEEFRSTPEDEEERYYTRRNTRRTTYPEDGDRDATQRYTTTGRSGTGERSGGRGEYTGGNTSRGSYRTTDTGRAYRSESPYTERTGYTGRVKTEKGLQPIPLPPPVQAQQPITYESAPTFIEFDTEDSEYDSRKAVYRPAPPEESPYTTSRHSTAEHPDRRRRETAVSSGPKVLSSKPQAVVRPAARNEVRHVRTKGKQD